MRKFVSMGAIGSLLFISTIGFSSSVANPYSELAKKWKLKHKQAGVDVYTQETANHRLAVAARSTINATLKDVAYTLVGGDKDATKWLPNLRSYQAQSANTKSVNHPKMIGLAGQFYGVFRLSSMVWDRDVSLNYRFRNQAGWTILKGQHKKASSKANLVRVQLRRFEVWLRASQSDVNKTDVVIFAVGSPGWLPVGISKRLRNGYMVAALKSLERTASYQGDKRQPNKVIEALLKKHPNLKN